MTRRSARLTIGAVLAALLTAGFGSAFGFWTVASEGNPVHAETGSIGPGASPTIHRVRHSVMLQWAKTPDALGYEIRRYADGAGPTDPAVGGCTTTTLACTEAGVPLGSWWYAVTPVRHLWAGAESPRVAVTVTDPAASIATNILLPAAGGHIAGGQLREFLPNEAVTLHLDAPDGALLPGALTTTTTTADGTASFTVDIGAVGDGPHVIVAVGAAADQVAATNPFSLDATAPVITLTTTPSPLDQARWSSTPPTLVRLDATDTGTGHGVRSITTTVNGGLAVVTPADTLTLPTLGNADNIITYFATDIAGNVETAHVVHVKIDGVIPHAVIVPVAFVKNGDVLKATGSSTAGPSGIASVSYLTCAAAACPTPSPIAGASTTGPDYGVPWSGPFPDGAYDVWSRVTSVAGLSGESDHQHIVVDNTAPVITLVAPTAGATFVTLPVSLSAIATDGAGGSGVASAWFEVKPSAGSSWTRISATRVAATTTYTATWTITGLTGSYDVRAGAADAAGNTSATPLRTVFLNPQATALQLRNGNGTTGRVDAGDKAVITFGPGMLPSLLCQSLPGRPLLGSTAISGFLFLTHAPAVSATDRLVFSSATSGVTCAIGSVDLGAAYVSGTDPVAVLFNTQLSFDVTTRQLTITVGARQSPTDPTIVVGHSKATYVPSLGSPVSTDDVQQF